MIRLPIVNKLPYKEKAIRAAGSEPTDFLNYMKQFIRALQDMYVEIANTVNKNAEDTIFVPERSVDPVDPAEGKFVIWMSDGTDSGDDGDILIKITAGGTTKTTTLVDFSAL